MIPASLGVGESFTCYGSLPWDEGQHSNTATVEGYHGNVKVEDSDLAHYFGARPSIALSKTADVESYELDDVITYTFVVTNTGNVTLTNVSVSDLLPGLSAITPVSVASLAPEATATFTATYTITQADVEAGQVANTATATYTVKQADVSAGEIENTATANATDPNGDPVSGSDTETVTLEQDVAIRLSKTAAPQSYSAAGDVITYTFVVTNTGNVTLYNVTIDDAPLGISGLAVTPSTLAPGATGTATATYTVKQADVDAGSIKNTATANATDPNGDPVSDSDTETVTAVQMPSIAVEKSVFDGGMWWDADTEPGPSLSPGVDPVRFRFVVTNTGNVTLRGITLADTHHLTFYAPYSGNDEPAPCVIPASLGAGQSFTCYGSLPWAEGQHSNTATVEGYYGDVNVDASDPAHYFGTTASIDVEKYVWDGNTWLDADTPTGPHLISGPVLFRFVVTNNGNVPLTGATLTDTHVMAFYADENLTAACVIADPLAVGASVTCYGSLPWVAGQHSSTATAEGYYGNIKVQDSDLAHYFGAEASIDVQKYVWDGQGWNDADVPPGPTLMLDADPVKFRFVVTNTGNVPLTGVTLSDTDITAFYANVDLTSACVIPDPLAAGMSVTCYGSLPWAEGQHSNIAEVIGFYDRVPYRDTDSAHYSGLFKLSEPEVDISLNAVLCAGWWNGFTIQITNTNDIKLTEVVVTNTVDLGTHGFDLRAYGTAIVANDTLTWTVGVIEPGEVVKLTFELRPWSSAVGSVLNQCVTVLSLEAEDAEHCSAFDVKKCDVPPPPPPTPTPTPTPSPTPAPCPACPDGVVFQSNRDGGDYDIYRMGFDGENVVRLTNHVADDIQPTWSFDASRIAFASNRNGDWDIYRMNADGSGQMNVTNRATSQDMAPSWSCNWIAFQSDRDGNWEIFKTDPNGLQQIRLTYNDAADEQPAWSPDGQWIAFQSDRDGQWEIYVMDAHGVKLQRITNHPAADRHPTWSPDGQWIAFTSNRDGQDDIYKVHIETGELVRLTDHLAADAHAAWMPYCEYIFFHSDRDEDYEVYRMGYAGENQTNISRGPEWIDVLDLVPGDAPDALFDRIIVSGSPVTYNLLINDIGGFDPGVIMEITMQPTHGTLQVHDDGTVTYVPSPGFIGRDVFAYRLIGPYGNSDETMVEVQVVSPAAPPQIPLFIPIIMNW